MIKYRIVLVGLLYFLSFHLQGQVTAIDSLKNALVIALQDTQKLRLYHTIIKYYHYRSSDTSSVYIDKALTLANDINDLAWIGSFTFLRAVNLQRTAPRKEVIEEYLKSIRISETAKDTAILIQAHAALINTYSDIGEVEKALAHYHKGKSLIGKDNLIMQASYNNRIGIVYGNLEDLEVAMRFFRLNLPLFETLGNNHGRGFTNMNIGILHNDLGHADSALIYLERGLKYHRLSDKPSAIAGNLAELGNFYTSQKKYPQALAYIKEAIALAEPLNFSSTIIPHYFSLANIYQQTEKYELAIKAAKKGLSLADETGHYDQSKDLLDILAQCSYLMKNYKVAYLYEKRRIAIRDTLFNESNNLAIRELEQKYQTDKQQSKIELQDAQLSQQRLLLIGGSIISILVLLLTFQIYRRAQQGQRSNQQLRQLDQAKSRFFANISHELRTPLTLILAPLEHALGIVKSTTAKNNIKTAHRNGKKLLTLVNEILDLSKLESGKMKIQETAVHLEKLLRRIFFSYQSLAQLRDFTLSFSYHLPRDLVVKLDVDKFEKVLNNLLSNAFKYSQVGGVITLRAESEGKELRIEITDTGKGISTDQLDKIFDRFYQAEGENEPLQGGTGIGLAYAKEIARLFNGALTVKSKIREGTTFSFVLPLKKTSLKVLPTEDVINTENDTDSASKIVPLSDHKAHVLIVEDNPEMSRFLVQSLSPHFQCSTAMDGEQALELLRSGQNPDLITSDVMMPNMDGFTFLEAVHNIKAFQKIPFILLTARALEEDKLKGLHLGVDDYLTKPFNTKELIARIQNLLKNKEIRAQYEIEAESIPEKEANFEEKLIKKAELLVLQNLSDTNYRIADFAKGLAYSPRQLERIFKRTTGLSPVGFIREVRLQKAYELLEKRQFASVGEVRFEVGIENASYFTRKFQERFGKNPKELMG